MGVPIVRQQGLKGAAKVTVNGASNIKVQFDSGQVFMIPKENAPDYTKTGDYMVTMGVDGDRIMFLSPVGGTYLAKFDGFSHKEGEPPMATVTRGRDVTSKDGRHFYIEDSLDFTVRFKVTSKKYADVVVFMRVPYSFGRYEQGGAVMTAITGKGMKKCEKFLKNIGFNLRDDTIDFSENVLPFLEKAIYKLDKEYTLRIGETGWLEDFFILEVD
jgi:hypothetical protein